MYRKKIEHKRSATKIVQKLCVFLKHLKILRKKLGKLYFVFYLSPGKFSDLQPMSLSKWEKERERREFEQAALIYKPLAGVMEDRFTRAAQPDDMNNPLAVVEKVFYSPKYCYTRITQNISGKTRRRIETQRSKIETVWPTNP